MAEKLVYDMEDQECWGVAVLNRFFLRLVWESAIWAESSESWAQLDDYQKEEHTMQKEQTMQTPWGRSSFGIIGE